MRIVVCAVVLVLTMGACAEAQNSEFSRIWEEAQLDRPREIPNVGRIAAADEPGEPLRIGGTVWLEDRRTPAAGVVVFAWQTDASGRYGAASANETWRLRGWARTDVEGRFEFITVRPGSYPGRTTPAHVHFTLEGPGVTRRWTGGIEFADDPLQTDETRRRSEAAGRFGPVRPVQRMNDGTQVIEIHLLAEKANVF